MKKINIKVKTIIISLVIMILIGLIAWMVIDKIMEPRMITAETPNSLKPDDSGANLVIDADNKNISQNEYVEEENSSLYNYTNETYDPKDDNEQKAIKLAKKFWAGSEDDSSAIYVVMDKKGDVYSVTLYDTQTTNAFLWLDVNVKDGTVVESPAQYVQH